MPRAGTAGGSDHDRVTSREPGIPRYRTGEAGIPGTGAGARAAPKGAISAMTRRSSSGKIGSRRPAAGRSAAPTTSSPSASAPRAWTRSPPSTCPGARAPERDRGAGGKPTAADPDGPHRSVRPGWERTTTPRASASWSSCRRSWRSSVPPAMCGWSRPAPRNGRDRHQLPRRRRRAGQDRQEPRAAPATCASPSRWTWSGAASASTCARPSPRPGPASRARSWTQPAAPASRCAGPATRHGQLRPPRVRARRAARRRDRGLARPRRMPPRGLAIARAPRRARCGGSSGLRASWSRAR